MSVLLARPVLKSEDAALFVASATDASRQRLKIRLSFARRLTARPEVFSKLVKKQLLRIRTSPVRGNMHASGLGSFAAKYSAGKRAKTIVATIPAKTQNSLQVLCRSIPKSTTPLTMDAPAVMEATIAPLTFPIASSTVLLTRPFA